MRVSSRRLLRSAPHALVLRSAPTTGGSFLFPTSGRWLRCASADRLDRVEPQRRRRGTAAAGLLALAPALVFAATQWGLPSELWPASRDRRRGIGVVCLRRDRCCWRWLIPPWSSGRSAARLARPFASRKACPSASGSADRAHPWGWQRAGSSTRGGACYFILAPVVPGGSGS